MGQDFDTMKLMNAFYAGLKVTLKREVEMIVQQMGYRMHVRWLEFSDEMGISLVTSRNPRDFYLT